MATILGQPRVYHRRGDIVNFTCIVPLQRNIMNISWFLNDIPIEKSSATHGGINIETQVYPQSIVSKLTIFRVFKRDEGKYSCGGLYIYPASVILIVNDGKCLLYLLLYNLFLASQFDIYLAKSFNEVTTIKNIC